MKETYEELLARAPQDHLSKDFQLFLMNNNEVRFINDKWLVIENVKYWTPENDWLTAFYIGGEDMYCNNIIGFASIPLIQYIDIIDFKDRELLLKSEKNRSVKLFHVHLYKK